MRNKNRKGRGNPLPASASEQKSSERDFVLQDRFRLDLQHWVLVDSRVALRVLELIEDIKRDPFEGKGKPERLRHDLRAVFEWV